VAGEDNLPAMTLPFTPEKTVYKWQQGPLHMEDSGLFVYQTTVISDEVKEVGKGLDYLPELRNLLEHGKPVQGDALQEFKENLLHCQSLHIGHLTKLMS
jgi:hypothetical protein